MSSDRQLRRTHGGDKTIDEIVSLQPRMAAAPERASHVVLPPIDDEIASLDDDPFVQTNVPTPTDAELLTVLKAAIEMNETGELGQRRQAWNVSYRAYRNVHAQGSRYTKKEYGARSRLFGPKTRTAVRKALTSAATALFSTDGVVLITPQNPKDPKQKATADLVHELTNIRLDRSNSVEGIPWFITSMGACQEATITGLCCSKQYWIFEQDARGNPTLDKPDIKIVPLDDLLLDNSADWRDPVQGGDFFAVRYPMRIGAIKERMRAGSNPLGGGAWTNAPEKVIAQAAEDYASQSTRTARQGGADRHAQRNQPAVPDFAIAWVYECFVRRDGTDYQFWALGGRHLLSDPTPTREAYPHNQGERPYVMGFGALEAHNLYPMSMVEAMQPLQNEINDMRNLRIDTVRQAISPIAVVRRGGRVDMRNLHYRGPDATILVKDDGDVKFDRAPDPSSSAFAEGDRLNNDIDELTGSFSTSSVQSNRSLSDTVGGMQLMAGAGNAVTEFDLRVWIETWVEPVLRQLVRLEQYYETNEDLIGIAGEKAELGDEGFDPLELPLDGPILVKVDIGIGASDPMQKLAKFQQATQMAMNIAPVLGGQVTVKAEGLLGEIYGLAGYRDISRFFTFVSPEDAEAEAAAASEDADDEAKDGKDPEIESARLQIEAKKAETADFAARERARQEDARTRIDFARLLLERMQHEGMIESQDFDRGMSIAKMQDNRDRAEVERADSRDDRDFDREMAERELDIQQAAAQPMPRPSMALPSPAMLPSPQALAEPV